MPRAFFRVWLTITVAALVGIPDESASQEKTLNQKGSRIKVQAEAGIQLFPGAAKALLGSGAAYGVLVSWQPIWFAGGELAYQGANYNAFIDGQKVSLFENGAQASFKLSPNFGIFEPYALAGIGFSIATEVSDEGRKPILEENTFVKVPLGLGIDFHLASRKKTGVPHVTLGVRGVYRIVFHHPFLNVSQRGADQITLTGVVGLQI